MAAPPAPKVDIHDIATRLWETVAKLQANSHLEAAKHSFPLLDLISLNFAGSRPRST